MSEVAIIRNGVVEYVDDSTIDQTPIPLPLTTRLGNTLRTLLATNKDKVSKQTRDEIMAIDAQGQSNLKFGLVDDWIADIQNYIPTVEADRPIVAALKQQILAEFTK